MSLVTASSLASAETTASPAEPVTVENYNRAQTDVYFAGVVKNDGFGKFRHGRELAPIVSRGIVRPNRDTLYSFAVFDFEAGPVTVTLPDASKRFMVMQVVNEDQYSPAVFYGAGRHTLTKEGIGTRYGIVVVRMLVDPANPQDFQQIHALQDALRVSQQSPGTFEIPNWDEASLKKVHAALLQLGETISDTRRMFGAAENQVDPVRHLVGTALVWGGLPERDALYLPVTPARNDGATIHKLTVKDVPVDGLAETSIIFETAGRRMLKGFPNPVPVHRLTGVRQEPEATLWDRFGRADFVGRATEFARLLAAAESAASGMGGFVIVAGEPGVGKSRLTQEAAGALVEADWTKVKTECNTILGTAPFAVSRDLVAKLLLLPAVQAAGAHGELRPAQRAAIDVLLAQPHDAALWARLGQRARLRGDRGLSGSANGAILLGNTEDDTGRYSRRGCRSRSATAFPRVMEPK